MNPRFRFINVPHEVDQLKRRLYRSIYWQGTFIEQAWLVLRVLEIMHIHAGIRVSEEDLESWRRGLAHDEPLHLEVLQRPFKDRSLPDTLAYYGVADTVRRNRGRGYNVRFWQVQALHRITEAHDTINQRPQRRRLGSGHAGAMGIKAGARSGESRYHRLALSGPRMGNEGTFKTRVHDPDGWTEKTLRFPALKTRIPKYVILGHAVRETFEKWIREGREHVLRDALVDAAASTQDAKEAGGSGDAEVSG